MNYLEKIRLFFSRRKKTEPQEEKVILILEVPRFYIYPTDLLEHLCLAAAYTTKQPVTSNTDQIILYKAYDRTNNSFLGSFWAIEHQERYWGNFVSNKSVISCSKDAFRLEETDELFVPLENDGQCVKTLVCHFDKETMRISALHFKAVNLADSNETILHQFKDGIMFEDAVQICKKIVN